MPATVETISPAGLEALRQSGKQVEVIDVRTPTEFREVHVSYARNVPLDRLDPKAIIAQRSSSCDQPLFVICRSGARGKQACEAFAAAGYCNVINVEGGTLACEAAGLPLERGQKAISLERQMRILIGSLVLLGVGLGWQVHPGFYGLSAFMGAGLVFAGVTDICPMAMLVAKMPWNQVASANQCCSAK